MHKLKKALWATVIVIDVILIADLFLNNAGITIGMFLYFTS